jgi:uncharacterized protein YacL
MEFFAMVAGGCAGLAIVVAIMIAVNDGVTGVLFTLIPVMLMLMFGLFGMKAIEKRFNEPLIEHNMAKYVVDEQTGKTAFVYLEPVEFLNEQK